MSVGFSRPERDFAQAYRLIKKKFANRLFFCVRDVALNCGVRKTR